MDGTAIAKPGTQRGASSQTLKKHFLHRYGNQFNVFYLEDGPLLRFHPKNSPVILTVLE